MTTYDFTVLIPVYNEEECLVPNVAKLLRFFRDRALRGEIILGSNGSTDATVFLGNLLGQAKPLPIRFFHLERRGTVGVVYRKALDLAASPFLISLDMDLSVDLEFVPRALDLLRQHDLVVGSKRSGSQRRSAWRRLGSHLFILCAQLLLNLPYDDYSLGAKAYRIDKVRPLAENISEDTNYVLEILCASRRAGLSTVVLPVACRDYRRSRFNLLKEAVVRFSHLFGTWFRVMFRR
ncbi:glycosyltransferase family 2 protein [Syntrophobacter fumaroxidans]|uniref:Glycosyl transferase, family 2 n=1 Tax=Syntrophobacter fumaroxidans (strain DSM 10017 / MPOB) TaxID=335543 RepID=A0LQP9_SYNFM|nr:glycosyltransferase family 2 protein [Syntrophobacter fumaroxidans]ABK19751.1 glycosyl transferase, family 2 [Syntrophobacter fumaroxidans MPOB]